MPSAAAELLAFAVPAPEAVLLGVSVAIEVVVMLGVAVEVGVMLDVAVAEPENAGELPGFADTVLVSAGVVAVAGEVDAGEPGTDEGAV